MSCLDLQFSRQWRCLGRNAEWTCRYIPTSRRNMLSPSSGLTSPAIFSGEPCIVPNLLVKVAQSVKWLTMDLTNGSFSRGRYFSSPCPNQLYYQSGIPRGQFGRSVKLTTSLHLVSRLKMSGAVPPAPYIFTAWYLRPGITLPRLTLLQYLLYREIHYVTSQQQ
jgi:hypothetical protein